MKTIPSTPSAKQGHILMLTIIVVALVSFILVAYLTLVQSQNTAVMRSQAWNSSVPIIEAGIEDALTHLNTHGWTNIECDGWTRVSGNKYQITRSIDSSFYIVTINNWVAGYSNNVPDVDSLGYVELPQAYVSSGEGPLLAQINTSQDRQVMLGRGVHTRTGRDRIFTKALVARDSIQLNGNGIRTDSFDSSDPAWSTNGVYDPARYRANGDIAVNGSLENGGAISIDNANIFGHVSTGPNGTVNLGPNGAVGDISWQSGNAGIEPGYRASDMNVAFPDVTVPYSGGYTPSGGWVTNIIASTVTTNAGVTATTITYPSSPSGPVTTNYPVTSTNYPVGSPGPVTVIRVTNTIAASTRTFPASGTYAGIISSNEITTGSPIYRGWYFSYDYITGYWTNWTYPTFTYVSGATFNTNHIYGATWYDYVLGDGDWSLTTLNGTVYVGGNARLYVSSTLNLGGLVIADGKKFELYSDAPSVTLSGNNTANSDGRAGNFLFWGTTNVTSITLNGNAGMSGAYYAPNADLTVNGTGNSTAVDFTGAGIVKSATMNGHFNFHYDEALAKFGPDRGWFITSWNEMNPSDIPRAVRQPSGQVTFTGGTP
ncbi:MAG TPA: hypothetical protein VFT34_02420 [Verrucomicrobiae bacterium]|nr:hypothetical protein [Verrucomicrobiae bacterium]